MKKPLLLFNLLLFFFWSSVAMAIVSEVTAFSVSSLAESPSQQQPSMELQTSLSLPQSRTPRSSSFISSAEFQHLSFLRANKNFFGADHNSSQLTATGVGVKSAAGRTHVDAHWFYVPQEDFHYFNVPELSVEKKWRENQLWLGRHLHQWSAADSFWDLGIWQPRFLWDRFRPVEQGLTGVFYQRNLGSSRLNLFVSGVYVPDISATFREKDGRIESRNPWFRSPPSRVDELSGETPVSASVKLQDPLLKPSAAVQVQHVWNEDLDSQMAYAYKPINQARLTYEFYKKIAIDTNEVVAIIHPQFPYEHVFSFETNWRQEGWSLSPSLTYQKPQPKETPYEWIAQGMTELTTASLVLRRQSDKFNSRRGNIYGGLIRIWSDSPQDLGEYAQEKGSQFDNRAPYLMAYRLGYAASLPVYRGREVSTRFEGTFDSFQNAVLLQSSIDYKFSKVLTVGLDVNLIGAVNNEKNNYEKSYLRTFRANDNLNLGIDYVF